MKFLVDMPLSPELARWLKGQGHEAVHAGEDLAMDTASDEEILQRALREKRVVVTADLDFSRLFALMHLESPGLILFRGGNYSEEEARTLLARVLDRLSESEISFAVTVVDKKSIRRRDLPIRS